MYFVHGVCESMSERCIIAYLSEAMEMNNTMTQSERRVHLIRYLLAEQNESERDIQCV